MSNNTRSTSLTEKIRSSLVLKLNFQMIGRLLSAFLSINILILIISLSVTLWKAEEGAQDIFEAIISNSFNYESIHPVDRNYEVITFKEAPKGFVVPRIIQKRLPVQAQDVKRSISRPKDHLGLRFLEEVSLVRYNIEFSINDTSYRISFDLGKDLRLLIFLIAIIFILELLIIMKNILKGSKAIKGILKPLTEMAEKARQLQDEVYNMPGDRHIKDLAGAISDIDASRLDRRISVDDSQNELKDLASAINDMLNRISASYQSQLRFVSDASHELRTPISVIQGYVNLLDRWGKNDEKTMQESIDAIKSETQSMKELVEQLLFLARGDNDTIQLHRQVFDSCDVVEEIVNETQMIDQNHLFEMELKRPATVNADKQLFKQVIRILVDNSLKYTPPGEKIIIRVAKDEDNVRISVQDNGIGIAPEELSYIFERFYRSDESRARKTGGSGLGLSIAKWIVERHGGYFEVLSRVDIGTRITVVIPSSVNSDIGIESRGD